jgi:hypothetical protein
MNMPNDFFARRLAAIEQEKAGRLAVIEEEEKAPHAHANRFNRVIPLIVDCIKKMCVAELSEQEIADLLRAAAEALDP